MNLRSDRDLTSVYRHKVSPWMKCLVVIGDFCLMERDKGRVFLPSFSFSSLHFPVEPGEWRKSQKAVWGSGSELTLGVWQDKCVIPHPHGLMSFHGQGP